MIVSIVKFWFSPSLLVSRVTKFDDDMVVASEEFEGGWVGTFFFSMREVRVESERAAPKGNKMASNFAF